jgi:acetamidase/formamidase
MGTDEDLKEAAKIAVREMINLLRTEKGLSREQAYMLCSSAVDFNITQLVDGKPIFILWAKDKNRIGKSVKQ